MESLSFAFIAIGALAALVQRALACGGRLQLIEILAILSVVIVALMSFGGVFIGPIGDARSYHGTINACFASPPPCGSRLHEHLWGLASAIMGVGWGLVYGLLIAYGISLLSRSAGLSRRTPILSILFLYSAYQIGNGMGEGTYFILLLAGVIAAHAYWVNTSAAFFLAALVAHLGNAPFAFYLLRFPRGWPLLTFIGGSGLLLVIFALQIQFEDLYSIIGKAGALVSQEAAISAVEAKTRASILDAETSYAELLLANDFPYSATSIIMSLWLYLVPILPGMGFINLLVSTISAAIGAASFWLARRSLLLLAIVVFSVLLFGPTSFTPGIGLRHKVPVFLFILMATNPMGLRAQTWRK